jgi:hypothetical protein
VTLPAPLATSHRPNLAFRFGLDVSSDDRSVAAHPRALRREATSAEVDLSQGSIAFSSEAPVIKMKVRDGGAHAACVSPELNTTVRR